MCKKLREKTSFVFFLRCLSLKHFLNRLKFHIYFFIFLNIIFYEILLNRVLVTCEHIVECFLMTNILWGFVRNFQLRIFGKIRDSKTHLRQSLSLRLKKLIDKHKKIEFVRHILVETLLFSSKITHGFFKFLRGRSLITLSKVTTHEFMTQLIKLFPN